MESSRLARKHEIPENCIFDISAIIFFVVTAVVSPILNLIRLLTGVVLPIFGMNMKKKACVKWWLQIARLSCWLKVYALSCKFVRF